MAMTTNSSISVNAFFACLRSDNFDRQANNSIKVKNRGGECSLWTLGLFIFIFLIFRLLSSFSVLLQTSKENAAVANQLTHVLDILLHPRRWFNTQRLEIRNQLECIVFCLDITLSHQTRRSVSERRNLPEITLGSGQD